MSGNGLFLGVRNVSYRLGGVKRISTPGTPILHGSRRAVADGVSSPHALEFLGVMYLYPGVGNGHREPERTACVDPVQNAAG